MEHAAGSTTQVDPAQGAMEHAAGSTTQVDPAQGAMEHAAGSTTQIDPGSGAGLRHGLEPGARASVLVEALPYIRRFWQAVVVVKYGGNALAGTVRLDDDGSGLPLSATAAASGPRAAPGPTGSAPGPTGSAPGPTGSAPGPGPAPGPPGADHAPPRAPWTSEATALASFAEDVVLMRSVGMLPVVVHGGGPQIGALMARLGKEPVFRDGLRVTDADTLDIARMVLVGKVNRDIVSAINIHGALAVGLSGEDANLIRASARDEALGFVGDVDVVDPEILTRLLAQGLIPVVATIGADMAGQSYNINADTVAGAVAEALGATKLIYLTDVTGLRSDPEDPTSLVPVTDAEGLDAMVATGAARGGMVPKIQACAHAVRHGVSRAHILDGRVPHALLLELFSDAGVGTMIVSEDQQAATKGSRP